MTASRNSAQRKGLEAALKRLWPNGDVPKPPAAAPIGPAPAAPGPGDSEAPTLPLAAALLRGSRVRSTLLLSLALGASALLADTGELRAREDRGPSWNMPPLENLTVRGAIRIVDAQGNVVALLGHVAGDADTPETVALELHSPGSAGPRETLRLESLSSGAMASVQTPDRSSSITLVSGQAGPYLLLAQGEQRRVIGPSETAALPAVGSGPEGRSLDLTDGRAQPLAEGLAAVDLRLRGRNLRGRILNTSSVRHTQVEVELEVGAQRLLLAVPVISPANSTGFRAQLPEGVAGPALRAARVVRVVSTVHYDAHQPWSESARIR
jgi:hypothetical protein